MKPVFVDTSALIALGNPRDQYHKSAHQAVLKLGDVDLFVTSDFVIDETVTNLSKSHGARNAIGFIRAIMASRLYRVYYVDAAMLATSLDFLSKYADKGISCTDATTLAFVRTQKIPRVFSFDVHFKKLGLKVIP